MFWRDFGFTPALGTENSAFCPAGHDLTATLPDGVVAFTVLQENAGQLGPVLDGFPIMEMLAFSIGPRKFRLARIGVDCPRLDTTGLPETVHCLQAGDVLPLPTDPGNYLISSLDALPLLPTAVVRQAVGPKPEPEVANSPLFSYSLRGKATEFERRAVKERALLGDICRTGQVTFLFAPPNAGKTLITLNLLTDAIDAGRINPNNVFYINADDSSSGFATKMRLMDDLGVHTLAPGHKGFKSQNLVEIFQEVVEQDKARGCLIIIDTVKKFADLMHKSRASTFTDACRQVAMAGGTVFGLGHTTKNPDNNGNFRYAGTSDTVDDCDAAYIMTPVEGEAEPGEKVVLFKNIKRRGNNAVQVAYAYADEGDISYDERLASVRLIDPDQLGEFQRIEEERSDAEVIAVIKACISEGIAAKMVLAKEVARRAKISGRSAIRTIENYTGDDPTVHHWNYAIKHRGAKQFALLPPPEAEELPVAA
ncbi:hypothetical protein A0J57_23165 [Sphingobium sp. 22B]|nr:hypothetical protein AXW74_22795 [Sphingobium sp. AM]KYC29967.1 hypothetical protein A0J57_23165 [Sphingobium sp. 22B]OAP30027.1 hypothetical protein A8O16_20725 [Sphingobium sp. 20006FA]